MEIKKNGKNYLVKENKNSWTLELVVGKIVVSYNIKKSDCSAIEDLELYIAHNDLF